MIQRFSVKIEGRPHRQPGVAEEFSVVRAAELTFGSKSFAADGSVIAANLRMVESRQPLECSVCSYLEL